MLNDLNPDRQRCVVWKYPVSVDNMFVLQLPVGATPLSVHIQNGEPVLWCLVNPVAPVKLRRFRLAGTGHPIEAVGLSFIGTFLVEHDALVFHLFEVLE